MFEHVSSVQPTPPTPPPLTEPLSRTRPLPVARPNPATVPLADQAAVEMFKRTGLNPVQKIGLIVTAIVVLAAVIGVGIWLFTTLDPFTSSVREQQNQTNQTSTIPLQELDSDKDGVRDIDERRYGTDATLADTDADGLSDYAELNQYKTDPVIADTDGDTFVDGEEITNGYDPLGPGRL